MKKIMALLFLVSNAMAGDRLLTCTATESYLGEELYSVSLDVYKSDVEQDEVLEIKKFGDIEVGIAVSSLDNFEDNFNMFYAAQVGNGPVTARKLEDQSLKSKDWWAISFGDDDTDFEFVCRKI